MDAEELKDVKMRFIENIFKKPRLSKLVIS